MKKFLLILVASVAMAQTAPNAPTVRVVPVKNGTASEIYDNLSKLFPGVMTRVGSQIVINAIPASADMLEEAIKKLDVAPPPSPEQRAEPNVELTVYVLRGSTSEASGAALPGDLDATVKQLRSLFPYKSYSLMDTQILRARSGRAAEASATVDGYFFSYKVQPSVNPGKAPRSIRLGRLEAGFRSPIVIDGKTQYQSNGIITDIDAVEGQKTVVGKSNLGPDAVIVVVTPRVIE